MTGTRWRERGAQAAGFDVEASKENQSGSIGMRSEMRTTKGTKLSKFERGLWMARPIVRRLPLSDPEQLVLNAFPDAIDGGEGLFQLGEFGAMIRTQPA